MIIRPTNPSYGRLKAALAKKSQLLLRENERRKEGQKVLTGIKRQHQALLFESKIMQRKLRQLARKVISAHEEERKEISRELHDEVLQTLLGINAQLSALGKGAADGLHTLKEKIAMTQKTVTESLEAVHEFARELRPAGLDDLGLIPALQSYCKNLTDKKGLQISITAIGRAENLDGEHKIALYRVAQEALTNVVRHAGASQVRITLYTIANAVQLEIKDNGRAFEVGKAFSANTPKRLGLIGMRERVEMVGGCLAITSAPGRGTAVRVTVPISGSKGPR